MTTETALATDRVPATPSNRRPGGTGTSRSLADRNRLIESHMHLAHVAAGRMKKSFGRYLTMDELVGYATEGLIDAADRFDPKRASFAAFSYYRIKGAIIDGLRRAGWYSRYDVARFRASKLLRAEQRVNEVLEQHLEDAGDQLTPSTPEDALRSIEDTLSQIATVYVTSLDSILAFADYDVAACREAPYITDDSTPAPDQTADLRGIRDRLHEALTMLPDRERRLIELHYFADQDLQDAGATLGLSKWATSRLHSRAVRLLRDVLANAEDPRY
jgi:RNA polymerase sigma factor FliA